MAPSRPSLQVWERLEEARLRWKLAHDYLSEVNEDLGSGAVPLVDGNYACARALHAEQAAIANYLDALQQFRAALGAEEPATVAPPPEGRKKLVASPKPGSPYENRKS